MAGAQCREVGREGGAADFAELCIAGVSEGAARTAGGREEAARTAAGGRGPCGAQGAMPMRLRPEPPMHREGKRKRKEGKRKVGWPAEPTRLGGLYI